MYIYKRLLQGGSFLINQVAVVLLIVLIILPPASTFALSSCTATVSPNTADAGSSATATFVITNNDNTANINWFHIQRPSEYFWISGVSDSAWTVAGDSSQLYFSGDTLAQGQSASIDISFTTDVQNVSAQNWGIEASDTGDATASVPCDGAHLTNVVGNPVNNTDNGVSGVFGQGNGTTAVITWNSDYPTSSYVYYGTTSSYGSVSDFDPTQVQDHSVTLTGLAPSTGYHFQVAGTDSAGSSVWSADSTFISDGSGGSGGGSGGGAGGGSGGSGGSGNTGGSGGGTGGSTNNNQQQNNNSQSNSTNVKPLSAYAPIISIDSKLSSVYKTPPTVAGSVKGAANITKIEYSIDNAKNWLPVDSSFGLNTLKATFTTTPINLKDGNYFVTIRAYDDTGNFSVLKSNTFVIDLIPPLVGTANVNIGAQTILPNTQGVYNLVAGTDTQITLNAVGGAINISLEAQKTGDTKTSYTFVMNHSSQTGLWTGIASFILPGEYTLQANAVDGANNSTSRTLGVVNVQNLGEVKDGSNNKPVRSVVSVYYLDPETNTMVLWDAGSSNQSNPLNTKDNGKYSFYLPAGTYYIKFESRGYKNVIS
ncbi:MAG: fibronectin type III domain-containing protein, partial [bacterium]